MEKAAQSGHPKGLYVLFFSEMWERFCYYGMRALLVLYLVETLLMGDNAAFAIFGTFTALVYMAPVLGGMIADKLLGYKNAVIFGGILMSIGEFMILGGSEGWLYIGMGAIIVGNGYFKANISSIVGKLYEDGDSRRDSGFTIFYIGINIGALLATTVCATVGEVYGFEYGFGLAGIGMIAGVLIFVLGSKHYQQAAQPPNPELLNRAWIGPLSRFHAVILGSIMLIPLLFFLIQFNELMNYLLPIVGIYVVANLLYGGIKEGPIWRDRMIAMIIIFVFNIAFWACFEQAGSSLTLFAKRNVDRIVMGGEMPASATQFFNPAYIIIFGSIFSMMWIALQKRKMNPSIPLKFGMGIIQLGLGYLVILLGGMFLSEEFLVPLWTLAVLYLLHTTGELFLSPIGLSMVTKLAPKHMTGTAMGGWFLSFAFSNYVAAIIAMATGIGHGGGDDKDKVKIPYNQLVNEISVESQRVQELSNKLVMSADALAGNMDGLIKEDEKLKNLPSEIKKMAAAVGPTLQIVNQEVLPRLQDTTWYNEKAKLSFTELAETYQKAVHGFTESLRELTEETDKLAAGSSYADVKDVFSTAVITIGDGFNKSLSGGVMNKMVKKSKKAVKFEGADKAIEDFEPSYATIASHMYWQVYSSIYMMMGLLTIAIGLILCAVSKPLNKLMHGVT